MITKVDRNEIMTRIAKGKQSGELWDRVVLSNGIVGYVFQDYMKEVPNIQISEIKLHLDKDTINKNERIKINMEILPEEAKENKVYFSSSNPNIALVDDEGIILGVSSGNATITARANSGASRSIKISVYSPVTDILLDTENITLQIGQTFTLNPIIYPHDATNKNISFNSQNENIAKIDEKGIITALQEGKTTMTVCTEDGQKQASLIVNVIKPLDETELLWAEDLTIIGNEISGFDFKNNTVKAIKQKVTTNYEIKFYNSRDELLSDDRLVGSGSKIRVIKDNAVIFEYIVILYGDVNGDGKINSVDLLVLQRHILEIEKLKGVFIKAGNIQKNGKNPSSLDCLLIQRHVLQLKLIEQ